jgi:superfamily II RNA helicase
MPEMPPATLLAALESYNLLPAIVFLPTRRRCDQAASEAALARRDSGPERLEARRALLRSFVEEHAEVRGHRHWDAIIRGGVAAHHAGHIPAWKLVIERLMSAGLLDAIFATATVAAGVDFPARTVVITNVDARTAGGWRLLSASELQQMTGRAGRRGRDRVGFIVAAPGLHQDPERIALLLEAPPDPLQSQFRATYSTLLNLLDAYKSFAHVRDIAERSFAFRDVTRRITRLERERSESERRIRERLDEAGCRLPNSVARGLERLASARARLLEHLPQTRAEVVMRWLDEVVVPGRIVGVGRSGRRLVLVTRRRGPNLVGIREDGRSASLALERIGRVYEKAYPLNEDALDESFADVRSHGRELLLHEPRLRDAREYEGDAVEIINRMIDELAPTAMSTDERSTCAEALWSVIEDAERAERAEGRIETLRAEVWQPFERRAHVLSAFGYLDFAQERVTERGKWLADLHVDRTLLVGEAVRHGLFDALDMKHAAGLMAALASDADRDYGELALEDQLVTTLARFEEVAYRVATEEWKQGLEPAPEINFSAAGTAARWAGGAEWKELVEESRAEEGDLVRMLSRTGESLLQIAGLRASQARAAHRAALAAEAVLREPVR